MAVVYVLIIFIIHENTRNDFMIIATKVLSIYSDNL